MIGRGAAVEALARPTLDALTMNTWIPEACARPGSEAASL